MRGRLPSAFTVFGSTGLRVALIHDYLTQYGGAERVLEVLHDMYPDAPVYTSLFDPHNLPTSFQEWEIHASGISRIPGASKTHRLWTPVYPALFRRMGRSLPKDLEVVIADTSAFSHNAVPTSPNIPLIAYCHSPARFLYGDDEYLDAARLGPLRPAASLLFRHMRKQDKRAAQRVTTYIANSNEVRDRIRYVYDRDAEVIYPPVDLERFRPLQPVPAEDWYLVVSRLVPHKWIDRAVRGATLAGVPLKVIGSGRAGAELQAIAGSNVEFLGDLPDTEVVGYMQRCRALILPGVEDFGMTAVEAQAAGRPVLAARGGGALETVIDGVTGWHFGTESDEELVSLLTREDAWDSAQIQRHAAKFSRERFELRMQDTVKRVERTGR